MVIDGYIRIDGGTVPPGVRWEVGRQGERLVVAVGGSLISLNGKDRDRFAEAVARAVTPGQPAPPAPCTRIGGCLAETGARLDSPDPELWRCCCGRSAAELKRQAATAGGGNAEG